MRWTHDRTPAYADKGPIPDWTLTVRFFWTLFASEISLGPPFLGIFTMIQNDTFFVAHVRFVSDLARHGCFFACRS